MIIRFYFSSFFKPIVSQTYKLFLNEGSLAEIIGLKGFAMVNSFTWVVVAFPFYIEGVELMYHIIFLHLQTQKKEGTTYASQEPKISIFKFINNQSIEL